MALTDDDKRTLRDVEVLLWAGWDPIGCSVPRDEYDTYAAQVFGMLKSGKTAADVQAYLLHIEIMQIGVGTTPMVKEIVAEKAEELVRGRSL